MQDFLRRTRFKAQLDGDGFGYPEGTDINIRSSFQIWPLIHGIYYRPLHVIYKMGFVQLSQETFNLTFPNNFWPPKSLKR